MVPEDKFVPSLIGAKRVALLKNTPTRPFLSLVLLLVPLKTLYRPPINPLSLVVGCNLRWVSKKETERT